MLWGKYFYIWLGQTFLHQGVNKHSYIKGWTNIFLHRGGGGQTFHVGGSSGGYDDVDVDKEMDVSEANFLVNNTSKLSAGAGILA